MKKILLLVNDPLPAENALASTIHFLGAHSITCSILLLRTYLVPKASKQEVIFLNDQAKDKSQQELLAMQEKILKYTSPWASSLLVESQSTMGSLRNIIPQIIEERKIDLVIVGAENKQEDEVANCLQTSQYKCPLLIIF
jgi:hypothetical protein